MEQTPAIIIHDEHGQEVVMYGAWPKQLQYHESTCPNLLGLGTRGTGKAVALGTPIPTPQGYRVMSDLTVGGRVFDESGKSTRIIWKSEPHIDHTGTYRLTFDDGEQIVCGGQHDWFTLSKVEAARTVPEGSVKTTQEVYDTVKVCHGRETNHRIPLGQGWHLPKRELPIDPYVLGVWLGDGHKDNSNFTSADIEVVNNIKQLGYEVRKLKAPYVYTIPGLITLLRALDAEEVKKIKRGICASCQQDRHIAARYLCKRCYETPSIRAKHVTMHKGFKRYRNGLLSNKRIPFEYLWASKEQRLSLLQGLLDTDGCCDKRQGSVEFCNTNKDLADGVYHLAVSLGLKPTIAEGRATLYGKDCGPKYRVCWTATLPVFRLERKLQLLPVKCRPTQSYRYIVAVERIADQLVQCIEVENPSHLYLVGHSAIPTHNSLMLRADAHMRCLLIPNFRALIIRRTMPELRKSHLNDIDYEMHLLGGGFLKTVSVAHYPNGSTLTFAHCETEADVMNFLSSQYGFIGFDELSTFTLEQFLKISAAARAPVGSGYTAVVRTTSNTLGIGSEWMKAWFVDKDVRLEDYPDYNPDDFQMIFSTLDDNPSIDANEYRKRLKNLPDHIKRAWLLGEFIVDGAYFTDFRRCDDNGDPWHVIDDVPTLKGVPLFNHSWLSVYRAIDWGYSPDPAVCLWIAVLPNKRAIVFKERTWRRTLAADVATQIKKESEDYHIVETFADPTMFIKTGTIAFSIAELFEQNGVPLTPSLNDRELYGYAIQDHLSTLIDGTPKLQIVKPEPGKRYGCHELLRTIPQMRTDPKNTKKMADGNDHWVISLAYFCMGLAMPSRDPVQSIVPRWMMPKSRRYDN